MAKALTQQQENFARYYVTTGKGASAYRLAYDAKNSTPNTIWSEASRLLANPMVAARIKELGAKADERFVVNVESISLELARAAFFDVRDLLDEHGAVLSVDEWPLEAARMVTSMEIRESKNEEGTVTGRVKKLRFVSKITALEHLARWKRMLVNLVEVGAPGEFELMTDEQLRHEIAANEAALKAINKARAPVKPKR